MQYMLAAIETETDFMRRSGPDAKTYWAGWQVYTKALQEAGVLVTGEALNVPDTATTVRARDGKHVIEDGPFSDSREQLAGFYVIEVSDLDAALAWAARMPCAASGAVEVRPVLSM